MAHRPPDNPLVTEKTSILILTTISLLLALLIITPYLQYVLFGVVLAYLLAPGQAPLERYLGPTTAALTLIAITLLVIIVPIAYIITIALSQAITLVTYLQTQELDPTLIDHYLDTVGLTVDITAIYTAYQGPIANAIQGIATGALNFVGGLPSVFIGLTITLFVLFSLLRNGDDLLHWFLDILPLRDPATTELITGFDQLMWASVVGNVAVSALQAILLGIGLAIIGIPGVVFLTVATFILALLPIGAIAVWLPLSVYLLATNQPGASALVFGYGALVGGSDIYLRPAIIGTSDALDEATVVVGIFGGVALFGAVGLFIGPVILGGAKVVLDLSTNPPQPSATTTS